MYRYKIAKLITIVINVIAILIVFVPFSTIFYEAEEAGEGEWVYSYGFENFELIGLMLPFYLFWILFQIVKYGKAKIALGVFCLLLACFYSFYAIMACVMPIQDFMPSIGILLLFSLSPLLLLLFIVQKIEDKNHHKSNSLDDVLDTGL